jgi:hypothetical protein
MKQEGGSMSDKPIYKKWWFWLIVIIVLPQITKLIPSSDQTSVTTQLSSPKLGEKFKNMPPAEHLSTAKKAIEQKNYALAKNHLDAIPKDYPEISKVEILKKEVDQKLKTQELENKFTSDDKSIEDISNKLSELRGKLKKYYATADDVKGLMQDMVTLTIAKSLYENGKSDTEKRLHAKAASLLPKVQLALREAYASSLEEIFVRTGIDAEVRAVGDAKKTLRIKYALMSQPLVYKFQNEIKIDNQAKNATFAKLVYTNGFESDLGRTWSISLK